MRFQLIAVLRKTNVELVIEESDDREELFVAMEDYALTIRVNHINTFKKLYIKDTKKGDELNDK